jgi:hypothetical protein
LNCILRCYVTSSVLDLQAGAAAAAAASQAGAAAGETVLLRITVHVRGSPRHFEGKPDQSALQLYMGRAEPLDSILRLCDDIPCSVNGRLN